MNKMIKYKTRGHFECVTECLHSESLGAEDNNPIMVGSNTCQNCRYNDYTSKDRNTVTCTFKKKHLK